MKAKVSLAVLCALLATCEIPIGKEGQYGTAIVGVGYRLPAEMPSWPVQRDGKAVVK